MSFTLAHLQSEMQEAYRGLENRLFKPDPLQFKWFWLLPQKGESDSLFQR